MFLVAPMLCGNPLIVIICPCNASEKSAHQNVKNPIFKMPIPIIFMFYWMIFIIKMYYNCIMG